MLHVINTGWWHLGRVMYVFISLHHQTGNSKTRIKFYPQGRSPTLRHHRNIIVTSNENVIWSLPTEMTSSSHMGNMQETR